MSIVSQITTDVEIKTPYSEILPPLATVEFEALQADIEANGVQVPIVIDEDGNILDGHHRYKIDPNCPRRVEGGLAEPRKRAFVIRQSLMRRNMSHEVKHGVLQDAKDIVRDMVKDGATHKEIALHLGISRSTAQAYYPKYVSDAEDGNANAADQRVKIPKKERAKICERADAGESHADIAKDYGVSRGRISQIHMEEFEREAKVQTKAYREHVKQAEAEELERHCAHEDIPIDDNTRDQMVAYQVTSTIWEAYGLIERLRGKWEIDDLKHDLDELHTRACDRFSAEGGMMAEGEGQFGAVPAKVILDPSASDRLVRLVGYLQWPRGKNGQVFPGEERIAADLGWSVSKVQRTVAEGQALGLFRAKRGGFGKTNQYTLSDLFTIHVKNDGTDKSHSRQKRRVSDVKNDGSFTSKMTGHIYNHGSITMEDEHAGAGSSRGSKKRDPIWDAVCEVFGLKPKTKADRARVGKIVKDFKAKDATPDEIKIRVARYRKEWPDMADTPEAILKHWDRFAKDKEKRNDRRTDDSGQGQREADQETSGGKGRAGQRTGEYEYSGRLTDLPTL